MSTGETWIDRAAFAWARHDAGIRNRLRDLTIVGAVCLNACATATQPYCLPPEATRTPEASGHLGSAMPAASNAADEYARCKEMEADLRAEQALREEEARARQREAEQLERERQGLPQRE